MAKPSHPALFPPPQTGRPPARIRRERRAGWRLPPGAVCVDRSTRRWGNPFAVGGLVHCPAADGLPAPYPGPLPPGTYEGFTVRTVKDREDATRLYTAHSRSLPASWAQEVRDALGGRDLACWCPLPAAAGDPDWCHGAVLLQVANPGPHHPCH